MARQKKTSPSVQDATSYRHPEADLPVRPEIGAQAHFKKSKAPVTYRFDSSLAPELCWDGQFEDTVWEHLAGTVSAPFEAGTHRQVADKVIDPRGNELIVVKKLEVKR
jgi:hypothetical protein